MHPRFALFDTAIGACAIAWTHQGVAGTRLPERDEGAIRTRLARRFPDAVEQPPQSDIREAIGAIQALLDGVATDLTHIRLDLTGVAPFAHNVYEIARAIPHGETLTYGEIAVRLGDATLARAVGQALGRNPVPIIVPCHRVLAADGRTGGFSAPGGVATKLRMLSIERARTHPAPMLFDDLPLAARR